MSAETIALDHIDGVEVAARLVAGQLDDLLIDTDLPRPGTIYRAIADRPVKGQGGMFVRTPDGPAFLRQVKGLAPGQPILVQVTGYAEPGKAVPVTTRILFKSRFAIITPDAPGLNVSRAIRDEDLRDTLLELAHAEIGAQETGLILRSACADGDPDEIADDIRAMRDLAVAVLSDATRDGPEKLVDGDGPHALAWRDWGHPAEVVTAAGCLVTLGVRDQIDMLRDAQVSLATGGFWYIEPTRALVAVDVNTGGDVSPAAGLKANLGMARDLPRQLRLRGLGGQITLDLAPMPKKDRRVFETTLRAAFRKDPVETALAGWSPLGHFELQRKRDRLPLTDVLK
ncbi:MAG: ribonuclease E/G [Paracoccaceae bacterium]